MKTLPINPLLAKELRLRMRNWRTFLLFTLYLVILGGFGVLNYAAVSNMLRYGTGDLAQVGQTLFVFLAFIQFGLIFFLVPGLTAGALSNERERQTFDLLVCTQLTPFAIVRGKLFSSLSFVFLLIFASLPLYGFVFLLGGVSPTELMILIAIFILTALIYGSFSLLFSSLFKRTITAVIASYAFSLFLVGGTAIIVSLFTLILFGMGNQNAIFSWVLLLHPVALFEWLFPEPGVELLREITQQAYPFNIPWLKFWHLSLLVKGTLAGAALYLATRAVNPLRAGRRSG
ncbi:MAG: ABC transporter permease [Firmicutes bacterium]|nr:ABC transporter permease [Bacillota bacterium]